MKLIFISFLFAFFNTNGIHSFTITTVEGDSVALSQFQGRKMLIVNIATGSEFADQLNGLNALQQQFGESLIVIGFPSNSFGNERRSNLQIKIICQEAYDINFLVAERVAVAGTNITPIYQWLTSEEENGALDSEVQGDFQKYLIDEQGELIGVFKGMVSPLDEQIVSLIR